MPAPAAQNTSSILAALAKIAAQNTTPATAPTISNGSVQDSSINVPHAHNTTVPQPVSSSVNQAPSSYPPLAQPVNVPAAMTNMTSQFSGSSNGAPSIPSTQPNLLGLATTAMPQAQAPAGGADTILNQQLMLLQLLAQQGVPQDQWANILKALTDANANAGTQIGNNAAA